MTSLASLLGSGIKSIQRGTISVAASSSATATITAVNTAKTELRYLGSEVNSARIALTNSTTVTATNAGGATVVVGFEITERF